MIFFFFFKLRRGINRVIESLNGAGVRFVHFSQHGKRQSVAFADKLGLETDWNFCISLKVIACFSFVVFRVCV